MLVERCACIAAQWAIKCDRQAASHRSCVSVVSRWILVDLDAICVYAQHSTDDSNSLFRLHQLRQLHPPGKQLDLHILRETLCRRRRKASLFDPTLVRQGARRSTSLFVAALVLCVKNKHSPAVDSQQNQLPTFVLMLAPPRVAYFFENPSTNCRLPAEFGQRPSAVSFGGLIDPRPQQAPVCDAAIARYGAQSLNQIDQAIDPDGHVGRRSTELDRPGRGPLGKVTAQPQASLVVRRLEVSSRHGHMK